MQVSKNELKGLVKMCWEVASEAELENAGPMYYGSDPNGYCINNTIRISLFRDLVSMLCPKPTMEYKTIVQEPKEPWQD